MKARYDLSRNIWIFSGTKKLPSKQITSVLKIKMSIFYSTVPRCLPLTGNQKVYNFYIIIIELLIYIWSTFDARRKAVPTVCTCWDKQILVHHPLTPSVDKHTNIKIIYFYLSIWIVMPWVGFCVSDINHSLPLSPHLVIVTTIHCIFQCNWCLCFV